MRTERKENAARQDMGACADDIVHHHEQRLLFLEARFQCTRFTSAYQHVEQDVLQAPRN